MAKCENCYHYEACLNSLSENKVHTTLMISAKPYSSAVKRLRGRWRRVRKMADNLRSLLILVGAATLIGLIFGSIMLLTYGIKNYVEKLRYTYKQKHRFDKKPIAKCYCID